MPILDKFNPEVQQENIKKSIISGIQAQYPIKGSQHTLELVGDLKIDDKTDWQDFPREKDIKLRKRSLTVPVKGNFRLIDNKTGRVLDETKDMVVANVPRLTNRFTTIFDGNEYSTVSQFRLRPGIYTRIQDNEELESQFNLARGFNFTMKMNPEDGIFYLVANKKKFNLYALLHALGVSDSRISQTWGHELYNKNKNQGLNKVDKVVTELYEFISGERKSFGDSLEGIKTYLDQTQVDPETTRLTLGESFDRVNERTLLATSKKLLKVHRGEEPEDERDSLLFKNLHAVDDLLINFFEKKAPSTIRSLRSRTDNKDSIREIISPDTYSAPIKSFFTSGELSNAAPQTNLVEMLSEWRKTTIRGEGGIQNPHAITFKTRNIHPTHLGFLDPLVTPESSKAGVTLSLGTDVAQDEKGLKTRVTLPTGETTYFHVDEMFNSIIGFPDQHENGKAKYKQVKGIHRGEQGTFNAKDVKAYLSDPTTAFAWTTNLIPFIGNTSGPRAAVAAKMVTQSVQLENPESPLVRAVGPDGSPTERTMEQWIAPSVPEEFGDAEVTKIEDEYITLKNRKGEKKKVGLYKDFPLNQESFLNTTPIVNVGDKVKKGSPLAKTNFSDATGNYAPGLNVNVAYMPYKGYNFEDGVVITESLAQRFTSEAMYKKSLRIDSDGLLNKKKFLAYYPTDLTRANADKLDDDGIIKEGSRVTSGDILVAYLAKTDMTDTERILKQMNRSAAQPYKNRALTWDEDFEGVVTYVNRIGNEIVVHVKTKQPMVEGDKLCYDEKTEILTNTGWKNFNEISAIDKFASINENQELEYVNAAKINIFDYSGKMYALKTTQVDLLTTPNHKQYAKPRYKETFSLYPSENLFGTRYRLKKNSINKNESISHIIIPELTVKAGQSGKGNRILPKLQIPTKTYMTLLGMFISEGNLVWQEKSGSYGIDITQIKSNNVKELLSELNQLGIKYCNNLKASNKIRIYSKQLAIHFKPLGKAYEKYIPNEIFYHAKEDLEILLKWLIWGDGHISKSSTSYTTTSKQLADDVQRLALHIGISANIKRYKGVDREFGGKLYKCRDKYVVYFYMKKNEPEINHGHIKSQNGQKEQWIDYSGKVFCPTLVKNNVVYVRRNGKAVWSGNSGRYGNKGIVTKIIADDEAPHTQDGDRIDLIINPHSVIGRMNMGQILETAAGKVAKKTGKPFNIKNFDGKDYTTEILKEMKTNNIAPEDVLLDGKDGKPFENPVFWGNQHTLKLMHVVDHKFKSRGLPGTYDANEQPVRSPVAGAQKLDPLQMYSYLAHGDTKELLYEATAIKGQKNDEYWRQLQLGMPPVKPKHNFVFEKMLNYMRAAGADVKKTGDELVVTPLTDDEVLRNSAGALKSAGKMLRGKDLAEIPGGLFDRKITGGMRGENWSHIKLENEIPHPLYEKAILSLLDMTGPQFEKIMNEEVEEDGKTGSELIRHRLASIDPKLEVKRVKEELQKAPETKVNKLHTRLRHLQALDKLNLTPDKAYMMKNVPVLPPKYRPVYVMEDGNLMPSKINLAYRDLALTNNQIKEVREIGLDDKEFNRNNRRELYQTAKALVGLTEPATYYKDKTEGAIRFLAGTGPKHGFIQNKVWSKAQDLAGRSTITIEPSLGLDEVGLPKEMAQDIFRPFVVKELVNQGFTPVEAVEQLEEWTSSAQTALENVVRSRPVILNRAPSLHKHSVQSFRPTLTEGKSIKLNPLVFQGFNADLDGDTMSVHVPISDKAVREAHGMMPSRNLWKAGDKAHMQGFGQDYILGLYYLSVEGTETGRSFNTLAEAKRAGLKMDDVINIAGKRTTLGIESLKKVLPQKYHNFARNLDARKLQELVDKLAKEDDHLLTQVMNDLKDLGRDYATRRGTTISITDMAIDRSFRDDILKRYDQKAKTAKTPEDRAKIYSEAKKEIVTEQDRRLRGRNNMYDMVMSGSAGKKGAGALPQILTFPGVFEDVHGRPLKEPVRKSWSEGLDSSEYFGTSFGTRKGIIDKAVNTQESGALNKRMLFNTKDLVITEEDCGTREGLELDINDKDIMDRYMARNVAGVGRQNDVIDHTLINKARMKNVEKLIARSPLTCDTADHRGVCIKCYGLMANGKPPRIGEPVGILDSTAVTERSTQLTMQTFHSAGAAGGGGILAGFPRLEELVMFPQVIKQKGVMAKRTGTVDSIRPNPAGGRDLFIDGERHFIPRERQLKVKLGDRVQKGDAITDGSLDPREISQLRDHLAAQRYIVDEMDNVMGNKFHKRTFETIMRGIGNNVELTDVPEDVDEDIARGGISTLPIIRRLNRRRQEEKKKPIKFRPYFRSIDMLPLDSDDWLSRLSTNRLKDTIVQAASQGMRSSIHGPDPMPGYLHATEFGQDLDAESGKFY